MSVDGAGPEQATVATAAAAARATHAATPGWNCIDNPVDSVDIGKSCWRLVGITKKRRQPFITDIGPQSITRIDHAKARGTPGPPASPPQVPETGRPRPSVGGAINQHAGGSHQNDNE